MFFFDFEGNIEDDRIKNLIESLKCQCNNFRLLGNYVACDTNE